MTSFWIWRRLDRRRRSKTTSRKWILINDRELNFDALTSENAKYRRERRGCKLTVNVFNFFDSIRVRNWWSHEHRLNLKKIILSTRHECIYYDHRSAVGLIEVQFFLLSVSVQWRLICQERKKFDHHRMKSANIWWKWKYRCRHC